MSVEHNLPHPERTPPPERTQAGPDSFDAWLAFHGLNDIESLDSETAGTTLAKAADDIESTLIQQEPGYPKLNNIYKASYVRGIMGEEIINAAIYESVGRSKKPSIMIGYEGLDVEIWAVKNAKLRFIGFKRQGYKEFNTQLSHDGANAIRDNLLVGLDAMYPDLVRLIEDNFDDAEALAQQLIEKGYGTLIESEQQIVAKAGTSVNQDELILARDT